MYAGIASTAAAVIAVDDYADFLAGEYLDTYVADGGAAVKFVVAGADDDADRFSATLRDAGEAAWLRDRARRRRRRTRST